MKWLVSDYDGTLKRFEEPTLYELLSLKKDLYCIKRFINAGNKFVISTGRSFKSIKEEILYNRIAYNYLTVNNGLVSFDRMNNIICANYLDKQIIEEIKNYLKETNNFSEIVTFNEYNEISNENIIKIKFKASNIPEAKKMCNELIQTYNLDLYTNWNGFALQNKSNKSFGIYQLVNTLGLDIENEDIVTVGDSKNDQIMIDDFNGYYMLDTESLVLDANKKYVENIKELIKKIKR